MAGFVSRSDSHFVAARFQRPSGGFFDAGSAKPALRLSFAISSFSSSSAAQHGLRRHHARRLLLVVQQHRLADGAVVVVVKGDLAVVLAHGLAALALNEHEGGAGDLEVAPVGLREGVRGEVGEQLRVQLVDLEQALVELDRRRHVEAGLHRHAVLRPWRALLHGRVPRALDVVAGAVVPEVCRRAEHQVEQLLGRAQLLLGKGWLLRVCHGGNFP
jgi:hypothetical protein